MGFPLRSNIFKYGTPEQAYFASFPVQVAVLFSPTDEDFSYAFREIFLDLDRLTGDDVVFFAVLDPPQNWVEAARGRRAWQGYQSRIGQAGFSVDDRVLVREIARLFGVSWSSLPSIVVGTNLWTGEFVTSRTSPYHIRRQLETLRNLVREWGQPNIGHIADTLSELFGFEVEYHLPDDELRYRFSRVYGILDTAATPDRFNSEQYQRLLEPELRAIKGNLTRTRHRGGDRWRELDSQQIDSLPISSAVDEIIEDAAGRLVAPATVAMKVFHQLRRERSVDVANMLEEESLVMVETALTVGNFLEGLAHDALRGIAPLRLGSQRTRLGTSGRWSPTIDYTPGAQGAWKAFELEVNLSVIQVARAARTIRMPDFFALYDSHLPKERSKVQTSSSGGKPIYKDINQQDWENKRSGRHRFLALGDAWYVVQAMNGSTTEDFDAIVYSCLGQPLSHSLLDVWQRIYRIRNKASHIQSIGSDEYAYVLESALSPDILGHLVRIKDKLAH